MLGRKNIKSHNDVVEDSVFLNSSKMLCSVVAYLVKEVSKKILAFILSVKNICTA